MQSAKHFFPPDFNQIWIFATDFYRRPEYQISREVRQTGDGLTYAVRRKNITKMACALWDYANPFQPILTFN